MRGLLVSCVLAAICAAPLAAEDAARVPIRLAGAQATVADDSGMPLLSVEQGDPAFAEIGNPDALILGSDRIEGRVLVSAAPHEPLWIACAELVDTGDYCAAAGDAERAAARAAMEAAMEAERQQSEARAFELSRGAQAEAEARARAEYERAEAQARGVPVCPGDPRCP